MVRLRRDRLVDPRRDPWRDLLLGPDGLRLDEWRAAGCLSTVKSGPHRIVYRVALPEGTLFIKHYLVPNRRAILRQWFRRGKGRNEGKRSQRLAATGLPTIWPIALGEQRKRRFLFENYLVTLEIADSVPLDEFVDGATAGLARAEAVPCPAAAGDGPGRDDGPTARRRVPARRFPSREPPGPVPDARRARAGDDRPRRAPRPQAGGLEDRSAKPGAAESLLLGAVEPDGPAPLPGAIPSPSPRAGEGDRRAARQIEAATRAWAERLWRRWGRRCRSSNKYFEAIERDNAWGVAARDLDPDAFRRILDDPDGPFRDTAAKRLKDSRTTLVAETTMAVRGRPTAVIYKRFNRKKWLDPVLNLFRPSRAWQSWQAGQHLVSRGIPTPKNLAYIERRPYGRSRWLRFLSHETYLVTVKEEATVDLATYVNELLPTLPADVRRVRIRRLTASLAGLIRSLHDRSLSHRDLKSANILIRTDTIEEEDRLSLIDLVGVRLRHPLPRSRRVQNLARLGISLESIPGRTRTDALRFLRLYLPWGLSPLNDWKSFWRSIERAMGAKRSRNLRRGRPLS